MVSENGTGDGLTKGFSMEEKGVDQDPPVVDLVLPLVQYSEVENGIEECHYLRSVQALAADRLIVFKEFHQRDCSIP